MSTITKKDIASHIVGSFGTQQEAKRAVDVVVDGIVEAITHSRGNKVQLPGLGIFQVKETAARKGRNPQTGETVEVPAGRKLAFKPAKDLKEKL